MCAGAIGVGTGKYKRVRTTRHKQHQRHPGHAESRRDAGGTDTAGAGC